MERTINKTKQLLAIGFCVLLPFMYHQVKAQGRFELEVDPTTFIFKGYSLHAGYQVGASKFNVGTYSMELPELLHGNKDFTQKNTAYQLRYEYLFQQIKGWYVGAQLDLVDKKITNDATQASFRNNRMIGGENWV